MKRLRVMVDVFGRAVDVEIYVFAIHQPSSEAIELAPEDRKSPPDREA